MHSPTPTSQSVSTSSSYDVIRPRPQINLPGHGHFVMCDKQRCLGEKCTHAHSFKELKVWNDELEASRCELNIL